MTILSLNNVSLSFPIYGASTRSLKKKIIQVATGGAIQYTEGEIISVNALKNVTLALKEGDRVGLIGGNGAGKSTLMRVMAGIYEPTAGEFKVTGKVTALLSVMLGLDPESSGFENITMRGILHGMTFDAIAEKQAEIARFTELEDYLAMPIRTYSAGMLLRLAFAIATSIEPEIFVLDEVVGVGDSHFLEKAKLRINNLIESAKIVVLASHDNDIIKAMCNKIVVMKAGEIQFVGDVASGLEYYAEHQ